MEQWGTWAVALLGPALVTAVLERLSGSIQRDYVFIYLGLVAVVGVVRGLWPALVCAGISFLLVDFFFVPPVGTLTIADEQDIVNLLAFLVTAGLVGLPPRTILARQDGEGAPQLRRELAEVVDPRVPRISGLVLDHGHDQAVHILRAREPAGLAAS